MKYKVIDAITGIDITHCYFWVVRPDGELGHMDNGDFTGYKTAKVVPIVEDWNEV